MHDQIPDVPVRTHRKPFTNSTELIAEVNDRTATAVGRGYIDRAFEQLARRVADEVFDRVKDDMVKELEQRVKTKVRKMLEIL